MRISDWSSDVCSSDLFLPDDLNIGHAYVTRLENYRVEMFLGIHEHELERSQPVLVSVEMLSLYDHPVEDEIREVVDYDFLRLKTEKLAKVRNFPFKEHFVNRVDNMGVAQVGKSVVQSVEYRVGDELLKT